MPETEWVPRGFEQRKHREQRDLRASGMSREVWVGPELLEEVLAHPRFSRLGLDPADFAEWMRTDREVRYADFVRGLFDAHGRHVGKVLVGEKSPGYVRHLPTLHFLWPRARVVHLIRDGRDVCVSLLAWKPAKQLRTIGRFSTWVEEPLITAGLWWEWHVRLGLEARSRLADALLEVRYEALVVRPEDECRALCAFLGLAYDDQMLKFFERAPNADPAARKGRGPAAPLRAGLRDWRRELNVDDRLLFEAAAGDLLEELGYGRSVNVDRRARERVKRVRERFDEEAGARRRKVLAWTETLV